MSFDPFDGRPRRVFAVPVLPPKLRSDVLKAADKLLIEIEEEVARAKARGERVTPEELLGEQRVRFCELVTELMNRDDRSGRAILQIRDALRACGVKI